ncbi:hypothetical protein OAF27_01030 [Verrucomicrobiales bacterium]|nr:hypothetical protein [Verrucomicrobiales bacterium]
MQKDSFPLHDPIEDDPAYSDRIRAVGDAVEEELKEEVVAHYVANGMDRGEAATRQLPFGSCHEIWGRTKSRLAEEGITWRSPDEMNPGILFD